MSTDWKASDSGVRWLEASLGPARVAFPARAGGVSGPPYDSLNLGISTGDDRIAVSENRRRLRDALGLEATATASAHQVHGSRIVRHADPSNVGEAWADAAPVDIEADAHLTETPEVALAVLTADCLAVAVHGSGGLGLAHCGWRGLAQGLAGGLAEAVAAERAVIGPGIGPCCYRVRSDVAGRFQGVDGALDGDRLDLGAAASAQLESCGVSSIERVRACTSCSEADFFSYRRDGAMSGRGGAVAWLT